MKELVSAFVYTVTLLKLISITLIRQLKSPYEALITVSEEFFLRAVVQIVISQPSMTEE